MEIPPRTFLFGSKAAPGYHFAKRIIKLITSVGDVINRDPDIRDQLKVVFVLNFNVTNGQKIYPAADLSEQISTAGKEVSGTGNMKFSINGALTIGTLDGAHVKIREEGRAENFFLFGLSPEEVYALKAQGYNPHDYYMADHQLKDVIDLIHCGFFSHGVGELFKMLTGNLMYSDPYLLLAELAPYVTCQARVSKAFLDRDQWTRMSILSTARTGKFSSDRSIKKYCEDIWKVKPVPITLLSQNEVNSGFIR